MVPMSFVQIEHMELYVELKSCQGKLNDICLPKNSPTTISSAQQDLNLKSDNKIQYFI